MAGGREPRGHAIIRNSGTSYLNENFKRMSSEMAASSTRTIKLGNSLTPTMKREPSYSQQTHRILQNEMAK